MTITRYLLNAGPEGSAPTTGSTGASSVVPSAGTGMSYAAAKAAQLAFGMKYVATNITTILRCATDQSSNVQNLSFIMTTPVTALTAGNVLTFFTGRSSTGVIFRLQWKDGNVQFSDTGVPTATTVKHSGTAIVLSTNTKYRHELQVTVGSTTAGLVTWNVYDMSDTLVGTCTLTNASLGTVPMTAFDAGIQSGITTSVELGFAEIQSTSVTAAEIGKYTAGANTPPSVSAGSDKTVTVNTSVSQTGTATDSDGTIVSTAWSFTSVPPGVTPPTISGASTLTATFTPVTAGIYVLRLIATDDDGANTPSSATIYVPASSVSIVSVTENSGAWVNQGGAANIQTALSDGSGATYVESPASPSTEATLTSRFGPAVPLSAATITLLGSSLNGSGALTVKVYLMEGATVRQTWTVTLGGDVVLTLDSATIAAIVNWNLLDVRLGAVGA